MIKLGDQVEDLVSGHKGIVTMRTKFLNGCVQYTVVGKLKMGEKPSALDEEISVDEGSLKVLKKNVCPSTEYPKEEKEETPQKRRSGGPTRFVKRRHC